MSDAGKTNAMPSKMSVASPTKPVLDMANLIKHLNTITKHPLTGPIAKPARSAGSSEICISKKLGNKNGKLNFAYAYKMNDNPVRIAILVIYAAECLPTVFFSSEYNLCFNDIRSFAIKKCSFFGAKNVRTFFIRTVPLVWESHPLGPKGFADYTASKDLHLAPKFYYIVQRIALAVKYISKKHSRKLPQNFFDNLKKFTQNKNMICNLNVEQLTLLKNANANAYFGTANGQYVEKTADEFDDDIEFLISLALQNEKVVSVRAYETDDAMVFGVLTVPIYLKSEREELIETLTKTLANDKQTYVSLDHDVFRKIKDDMTDEQKNELLKTVISRQKN